jgi:hypothetical protein
MQNTNDSELILFRNNCLSQVHANLFQDPAIHEWIRWINAPYPSVNFNAAYERMTEGTGMWSMQNPKLIDWKASGGLLWLQGKGEMVLIGFLRHNPKNLTYLLAGSGKTFLL